MAVDLKLNLKLSQQLVMTPQLQQAIKLLQLNRAELTELINDELVDNPVLDEGMETSEAESRQETEAENKNNEEEPFSKTENQEQNTELKDGDFDWSNYIDEYNSNYSTAPSMREVNEDLPNFESVLTKTTTLEAHLRWQLSMASFTEVETKFGELVIGNLSDDGYLIVDYEDIAKEADLDPEDAEEVLKMMQNFDPLGTCSRNLKECLLLQASFLEPKNQLVENIIENHLGDLEKKNYQNIAKALSVPFEEVIEATKVILEFEPKPGRSFQSSETQYITPDIYVYKVGEEFVIVLNEDGMPKLRISPYYKKVLAEAKAQGKDKEYVQDKLRSALWLIRSIHNRQKTIYKVTEAIVQRQRDFFEKGVENLRPMILKDVANDIGMHESTISRVTTNKYVHTPVGIFELKYFFNSSISSGDGTGSLASEAVKEKIRQLVAKEDNRKPLSDQKLVELLRKDNINIARRTVAKYREMLGILSSGKRKKVF